MVKITRERVKSLGEISSTEELIRSAIIAEMDATSLYQSQIENTDNQDVKEVLSHIRDEEKEHIAELSCLLMSIDSTQKEKLQELIQRQFPYDINLMLRNCIIGKTKEEKSLLSPTEEKEVTTLEEIGELPVKERTKLAREALRRMEGLYG